MSMKYIRDTYKVPAKRGLVIRYNGSPDIYPIVRILSARGAYLCVKGIRTHSDGTNHAGRFLIHPTWMVEYDINCGTCGKPVEDGRRVFVHPVCHACLSPPEPLPMIASWTREGRPSRSGSFSSQSRNSHDS